MTSVLTSVSPTRILNSLPALIKTFTSVFWNTKDRVQFNCHCRDFGEHLKDKSQRDSSLPEKGLLYPDCWWASKYSFCFGHAEQRNLSQERRCSKSPDGVWIKQDLKSQIITNCFYAKFVWKTHQKWFNRQEQTLTSSSSPKYTKRASLALVSTFWLIDRRLENFSSRNLA